MKIFFTFFLCNWAICLFAKDDYIYWSKDYKLKFEDFNAPFSDKDTLSALTFLSIDVTVHNLDSVEAKAVFIKNKSWCKVHCEKLLNHENRHFDLYEVYARILRKRWSNQIFNYNNLQQEFDEIFNLTLMEYRQATKLYDKETEHSINELKQQWWDRYIDRLLEDLDDYSSPMIYLRIDENN
jgi:hypothetical protein